MTQLGDRVEHAIEQRTDLEQEIKRAPSWPVSRIVRTVFMLSLTGISLYLVAPSLIDVFGSWDDLDSLSPAWLAAMAVLQVLTLGCVHRHAHSPQRSSVTLDHEALPCRLRVRPKPGRLPNSGQLPEICHLDL